MSILACPLLIGSLSSFGVSFIGGFTASIAEMNPFDQTATYCVLNFHGCGGGGGGSAHACIVKVLSSEDRNFF